MKALIFFFLIAFSLTTTALEKRAEDMSSATLRNDGRFDVVCIDGSTEIVTSQAHLTTLPKQNTRSATIIFGRKVEHRRLQVEDHRDSEPQS